MECENIPGIFRKISESVSLLEDLNENNFNDILNSLLKTIDKSHFHSFCNVLKLSLDRDKKNYNILLRLFLLFIRKFNPDELVNVPFYHYLKLKEIGILGTDKITSDEKIVECYSEIIDEYNNKKDELDVLTKYKYKMVCDMVLYGFPEDSIGYYIANDDFTSFIAVYTDFESVVSMIDGRELKLVSLAALYGAKNIFKYLLLREATVYDETVICAILSGNVEIISILGNLANFNYGDYISSAIQYHLNNVVTWITNCFNYNTKDLLVAFDVMNYPVIFYFIMNECFDKNTLNDFNENALHIVCRRRELDILKILLELNVNPNVLNTSGESPLIIAILGGDYDSCKLLLEHGADPNLADQNSDLPLIIASLEGNAKICELLLKYSESANVFDVKEHWSIIHCACYSTSFDLVKFYIEKDMQLELTDNKLRTPLHIAVSRNDAKICEYLLINNYDINAKDRSGETPLHLASFNGYLEVVELLLRYSADPNVQDQDGDTPLHKSSFNNFKSICSKLLDYNALINTKNNDGNTVLHFAYSQNYIELCDYLISKGADPSLRNNIDRVYNEKVSRSMRSKQFLNNSLKRVGASLCNR